MNWIGAIVQAFIAVLKGFFGADKPQKTTVVKPEKDVEVSSDDKSDEDRLRDLGL